MDVGAGEVLGPLLRAMSLERPDRLPGVAAQFAKTIGLDDLVMYLVDHEQFVLVPLGPTAEVAGDAIEIEGTLAGRAFTGDLPVDGDSDGRRRLWVPLRDGVDRFGVLAVTVDDASEPVQMRTVQLAHLLGQFIVTKGALTDAFRLARRRRPMSLAAELQWGALPPLTSSTPEVAIAGMLEPAYELGGDAFDYGFNGNRADFAIFDSMGHGLSSSVTAWLAMGAVRHSRRLRLSVDDAYRAIDMALQEQFGGERFVTAQIGELDMQTGRMTWVNAGHPLPVLVRQAKVVGQIECEPSLPLGLGGDVVEIAEVTLEPGDRLLFYSDGVIEAPLGGDRGEPFGIERLEDTLARATLDGHGPAETLRRLSHAVHAHVDRNFSDDATMLFVEFRGNGR